MLRKVAPRNDGLGFRNVVPSYFSNMRRGGVTYIITTADNTALYTGVTAHLKQRLYQHVYKTFPTGFTAKYHCCKLVYYRAFDRIEEAIAEEKRIKGGSRKRKIALIESMNPEWKDLGPEIEQWD